MTTQSIKSSTVALLVGLAGGCAAAPGAQPQDMSKTQHEQTATGHEQAAAEHGRGYDPSATVTKQTCSDSYLTNGGCWR